VDQKRRERPGFSYRFERGNVNTLRLIHLEMERGVPVYLATIYNQKVRTAYGGYPVGPLFRLLPPDVGPPGPQEVRDLNRRLFRGFTRRGRLPDPDVDPWAAAMMEPFAHTLRSVAHALHTSGDRKAALRTVVQAQEWAPWLPIPDWIGRSPGKLRRTHHRP
jgi:hypothetical protein